jgi:hypothetical protein
MSRLVGWLARIERARVKNLLIRGFMRCSPWT